MRPAKVQSVPLKCPYCGEELTHDTSPSAAWRKHRRQHYSWSDNKEKSDGVER